MLALEREEHAFGAARPRARLAHGAAREKVRARRGRAPSRSRSSCSCGDRRSSSHLDWSRVAAVAARRSPAARSAFGALGRRDRRARARGPGRLAARVPAHAADRLPRARPERRGRRRRSTTSSGRSRRCSRSARRCRRSTPRSTTPSPGWRPTLAHLAALAVGLPARSPAWRSPRFAMSDDRACACEDAADGDPPDRRPTTLASSARAAPAPIASTPGRGSPLRDESFYTRGRPARSSSTSTSARGRPAARYAFADPRRRRAATALIGARRARRNVVRGPWQNATLGYWIDEDARGRGHATRAVRLVAALRLRARRPAPRAAGDHPAQRRARVRVAEKAGFRLEGRALRYLKIDGALGGPRRLRAHRRGLGRAMGRAVAPTM